MTKGDHMAANPIPSSLPPEGLSFEGLRPEVQCPERRRPEGLCPEGTFAADSRGNVRVPE
jgi:hypothetical protein